MAFGTHDHPFYKPKWRRVAIVLVTGVWAGVEVFLGQNGFWTVLSVAVFVYCLWFFLLSWKDTGPSAGG